MAVLVDACLPNHGQCSHVTARACQPGEAAAPYRQLRQTVEHRIARLVQLGCGKRAMWTAGKLPFGSI